MLFGFIFNLFSSWYKLFLLLLLKLILLLFKFISEFVIVVFSSWFCLMKLLFSLLIHKFLNCFFFEFEFNILNVFCNLSIKISYSEFDFSKSIFTFCKKFSFSIIILYFSSILFTFLSSCILLFELISLIIFFKFSFSLFNLLFSSLKSKNCWLITLFWTSISIIFWFNSSYLLIFSWLISLFFFNFSFK